MKTSLTLVLVCLALGLGLAGTAGAVKGLSKPERTEHYHWRGTAKGIERTYRLPGGTILVKQHRGRVAGVRELSVEVRQTAGRNWENVYRFNKSVPEAKRARLSRPDTRALDALVQAMSVKPAAN